MASTDLLADLRLRLRDPDGDTYSDALIYTALADTQLELGNMLPVELLSEFITPLTSLGTVAVGGTVTIKLSVLKSYEQGILNAYYAAQAKWMKKIIDPVLLNNSLASPSLKDPWYRIVGNKFYAYPNTIAGIDAVAVDYLKIPTAISAAEDPTLNTGLHYLLKLGAEYRTRNSLEDRTSLISQVKEDYYSQIGALTQKEGAE